MSAPQFSRVPRFDGPVWMHRNGTMWIVKYDAIKGVRAAFFQPYKTVEKPPAGRMPWTVDNRSIGGHHANLMSAKAAIVAEVRS